MRQPGLSKILGIFILLFLLSRTGKIIKFFEELKEDKFLTLDPLIRAPEPARYTVTVALIGFGVWLVIYLLLQRRK